MRRDRERDRVRVLRLLPASFPVGERGERARERDRRDDKGLRDRRRTGLLDRRRPLAGLRDRREAPLLRDRTLDPSTSRRLLSRDPDLLRRSVGDRERDRPRPPPRATTGETVRDRRLRTAAGEREALLCLLDDRDRDRAGSRRPAASRRGGDGDFDAEEEEPFPLRPLDERCRFLEVVVSVVDAGGFESHRLRSEDKSACCCCAGPPRTVRDRLSISAWTVDCVTPEDDDVIGGGGTFR
jgi:hypothetical protein